ncbi:MAG: HD-GYP domain-containing protein [Solirubrobacteraceae bacterium]|nr:HD-GYP domain-containing protein [Solirubrobacteraceae bacterium]
MPEPLGLTEATRSRIATPMGQRELAAYAIVGVPLLVAGVLLAAMGVEGDVDTVAVVLFVIALAVMGHFEFEAGSGVLVPTQLIFVPMLFVLPPAVAPLVVVAALALADVPEVLAGRQHPQRLAAVAGDAWFALGPALVFVLADVREPALADWPVYLLALATQFGGELCISTLRERLAHGVAPKLQLGVLREVWLVDALLSPIGLLAALASTVEHHAYLLVMPLGALLAVFARERRERIGTAIELSSAYRGTALLLGDVLSEDDEYTGSHSRGVVTFALEIADELRMQEEQRRLVEFGALLHDIGKMTTPKEILHKPGPLDDDEWVTMRRHTIDGQRMLDQVGGTLHDVGEVVRSSHEHYDGSGYPDGLRGEAIPLPARVVAVADAYSAMTTRRTYREPMTPGGAIRELRLHAGTQFDPVVVDAALIVLARDTPIEIPMTNGADAA